MNVLSEVHLKDVRLSHGITLQQLVNKSSVSRTTVERAEKGERPIRTAYAYRIVNALNELSGKAYTIKGLGIKVPEDKNTSLPERGESNGATN